MRKIERGSIGVGMLAIGTGGTAAAFGHSIGTCIIGVLTVISVRTVWRPTVKDTAARARTASAPTTAELVRDRARGLKTGVALSMPTSWWILVVECDSFWSLECGAMLVRIARMSSCI